MKDGINIFYKRYIYNIIKIVGKKEGGLSRDNYSFRKRQKEAAKKKKKEEKRQRKLDRKNIQSKESEAKVPNEEGGGF